MDINLMRPESMAAISETDQVSILVVGQSDILSGALRQVMGSQFAVAGAVDATECEAICSATQPNLLICDESMVEQMGLGWVRQVHDASPSTKFVLLSGNPDLVELGNGLQRGCDYYTIRKPLNVDALKNKIKRVAVEAQSLETESTLLAQIQQQNILLQRQNKALEKLNQAKAQFVKRFVRKFSAPLTTMESSIKQLLRDPHLPEHVSHKLHENFTHIRQLGSTLNNLTVLGKLEDDGYAPILKRVDLDAIVSSVKENAEVAIKPKKIEFNVLKQHKLGHISTDADLLHHVFTNIMDSLILQASDQAEIIWELKLFDNALESVWEVNHRKSIAKKKLIKVLTHAGFELSAAKGLLEHLGGKLIYTLHDKSAQVVVHLPTP